MGRPVAVRVWNGSTSTGTGAAGSTSFPLAYFGTGFRYITAHISNPSTKSFQNKVQVSAGNSTSWTTVLANATSTGAAVARTSTGGVVFDKARISSTGNATTGVVKVWLVAGN